METHKKNTSIWKFLTGKYSYLSATIISSIERRNILQSHQTTTKSSFIEKGALPSKHATLF